MTEKKTGASLARHRSKQDIGTPENFLSAVQRRFGPIVWDLAATAENSVEGPDCYFGPGSKHGEDSLIVPWHRAGKHSRGVLWLNPPFGRIDPWAEKCATMRSRAGWTLLLVPAAVGSNWFQIHVAPNAFVLELQDRVTFVGSSQPYPKDLVLCAFGFDVVGRAPWHWDLSKKKAYERSQKRIIAASAAE